MVTPPTSDVTFCRCGKKIGKTDFLRGLCRACGHLIAPSRRY